MSKRNIIRAWKDVEYRNNLSAEERANLPENPAGLVELSDEALLNAAGANTTITNCSACTVCGSCGPTYCGSTCGQPVCAC